jgi:hypothetical protein
MEIICFTTTISASNKTRVTALNKPRAACTIPCLSVTPIGLPNVLYSTQVIRFIDSPIIEEFRMKTKREIMIHTS